MRESKEKGGGGERKPQNSKLKTFLSPSLSSFSPNSLHLLPNKKKQKTSQLRQDPALPHPLRHLPAPRRPGRRRGQGPLDRHRGHLPPGPPRADRRALRPQPGRRARQRRVRARAQHRPPGPAAARRGVDDGRGALRADHRRLGHGPVPHRVQRARRAVGAPDPPGEVPEGAGEAGGGVWVRGRGDQPGSCLLDGGRRFGSGGGEGEKRRGRENRRRRKKTQHDFLSLSKKKRFRSSPPTSTAGRCSPGPLSSPSAATSW